MPISEDNPRTVCLWARIDAWADNARLFEYGKGPSQRFGLRTYKTPGRFSVISHDPKRPSTNVTVDLNASRLVAPRPTPRPTIRGRRLDGTGETPNSTATPTTPPNPWVATWHHYCVTYAADRAKRNRANVTFYVDGVAEKTWNATVNTSASPLFIGADVLGTHTLAGAVDEIYIYEKALDAWQVGVLYGIVSPPPTAVPTGAPTSAPTGLPTPEPSPAPSSHPSASPAPSRYFLEAALVAHYGMDGGVAVDDHGPFGNATYVEGRTRKDTALSLIHI